MARSPAKRRRSRGSQERFRDAFLEQVADEVLELGMLLQAPDNDTLDTASAELERLADTAQTLGLGHLERVCRGAAKDMQPGRHREGLRRVAQSVRRTRGPSRLGPILVVAPPEHTQMLGDQLDAVSEHVRLFPDLESFTDELHVLEPSAVILPAEALDAVHELSRAETFPVLVHTPVDKPGLCVSALTRGASGYVQRPLVLEDITRQVRQRTLQREPPTVLVLLNDGPERQAIARAIETTGLVPVISSKPGSMVRGLTEGTIDAILLGGTVGGLPCTSLAPLIRGHSTRGHLPLMVLGSPRDPHQLRASGIDDLMREGADPSHVAQRVKTRVQRFMELPWMQHPTLRIATRLGILDHVDHLLRRTQRHSMVVSVGLLVFDGSHALDPHQQTSASRFLRQLVSDSVGDHLRRDDALGELQPSTFLAVLPDASLDAASRRLGEWSDDLKQRLRAHDAFAALSPRLGVADTRLGTAGVIRRAERALAR